MAHHATPRRAAAAANPVATPGLVSVCGSAPSTSLVDTLEPIQAYVQWRGTRGEQPGAGTTRRVGRMTADLGKRRGRAGAGRYRRLRLDEPRDEWVSSDYRGETGASGDSIGRYFEASAAWTAIEDRLTIETGLVRLSAGGFAKETAGAAFGGDPRYFYLSATTSF